MREEMMLSWNRRGEGPDVLLVHGFLSSGLIFSPLTDHLSDDFSVTTIDLPGFGESHDIAVPPTVEEQSELVLETVKSIGLKKFSILGHSLGAMIALEISLRHRNLLEKMVLYGGCPDGFLPDRFESTESSVRKLEEKGMEAFAAGIAAEWFRRDKDDPMFSFALKAGARSNPDGAFVHLRSWDHWKARDRLGDVTTSTLVACGDGDRSTHPDLSIEMWRKIPNAQLFIAPNAGHAFHLEMPETFNLIVERFLKE
ncbi:alpha/beta hydrolase [Defluviimonas sp. D31]|uniref:alpha/beta fold hydrolase n=1 Tax=Defluviimonas sp. D31 TaxID=3083253 RepID=UPI00296F2C72|nr:alpha/beta hydrolase [Defluviimonas sp. D31]